MIEEKNLNILKRTRLKSLLLLEDIAEVNLSWIREDNDKLFSKSSNEEIAFHLISQIYQDLEKMREALNLHDPNDYISVGLIDEEE